MVNFPGGFPGRFPGSSPSRPPAPPGPPGGGPPNRPPMPPGPPAGRPPAPPRFPGQGFPPNTIPGGVGNPPPPPRELINEYNVLSQNPLQAQSRLQMQGDVARFAAGCDGRWTIILLRNGQLFLMYVLSSNVFGNTMGLIWPFFTFGSFPSSSIAAYSCY